MKNRTLLNICGFTQRWWDDDTAAKTIWFIDIAVTARVVEWWKEFPGGKKEDYQTASALKSFKTPMVAREMELILDVQQDDFWTDITLPMLIWLEAFAQPYQFDWKDGSPACLAKFWRWNWWAWGSLICPRCLLAQICSVLANKVQQNFASRKFKSLTPRYPKNWRRDCKPRRFLQLQENIKLVCLFELCRGFWSRSVKRRWFSSDKPFLPIIWVLKNHIYRFWKSICDMGDMEGVSFQPDQGYIWLSILKMWNQRAT